MLALDDPGPAQRVGGQDVRAVVASTADLPGVGAPAAEHQVADRVLEVAVVQDVQLGQPVAQRLLAHVVPGPLLEMVAAATSRPRPV
ncbi:hypothetical protein ACIBRY_04320 [Streptomyces anulatus]